MKHDYAQFSLKKKKLTFPKCYKNWCNILLERSINIFKWGGLDLPPHELELLLLCVGYCGIVENKAPLIYRLNNTNNQRFVAVYGGASGPTNYPDIFTTFTYATPLFSGMFNIGINGIFCRNNQLCLPLKPIISNYAVLLAHTELCIQATLINNRDNKIFVTNNQNTANSIKEYYSALIEGDTAAIIDEENLESILDSESFRYFSTQVNGSLKLPELLECRENLLRSFYIDIGINTQKEKRESMNIPEVETNLTRLQYNISDMLYTRQLICEDFKKIYDVNVTVEINPEIVKQYDIMEGVQRQSNIDENFSRETKIASTQSEGSEE